MARLRSNLPPLAEARGVDYTGSTGTLTLDPMYAQTISIPLYEKSGRRQDLNLSLSNPSDGASCSPAILSLASRIHCLRNPSQEFVHDCQFFHPRFRVSVHFVNGSLQTLPETGCLRCRPGLLIDQMLHGLTDEHRNRVHQLQRSTFRTRRAKARSSVCIRIFGPESIQTAWHSG